MKKKNAILNAVMVALILVVIAGGVMLVGSAKGWFAKSEVPRATTADLVGSVEIQRGGIAYSASEALTLRDGDLLTTAGSSRLTIRAGERAVTLSEGTSVRILTAAEDGFALSVTAGQVYCTAAAPTAVTLFGRVFTADDAVFIADAQSGSASLFCLRGALSCADGTALSGGQALSLTADASSLGALSIAALSDFSVTQALASKTALCFTSDELRALTESRAAEKEALLSAAEQGSAPITDSSGSDNISGNPGGSDAPASDPAAPDTSLHCSIEIRCDTILSNMGDLTAGKNAYVPADGTILAATGVTFAAGETVFDVLKRVCAARDIQLEYAWTPLYNSYYVEGIHQLYEFDCGSESGWMYKVNGWFPNYGCSSYTLKDEDAIVWCYTCVGLGADVGGSVN